MKTIFALATLLLAVPAFADDHSHATRFLTVTITDIGRPYSVIDGACSFANGGIFSMDYWDSAYHAAALQLVVVAQKAGGDAVVGMHATPVWAPSSDANTGVMVCGTIVKFK